MDLQKDRLSNPKRVEQSAFFILRLICKEEPRARPVPYMSGIHFNWHLKNNCNGKFERYLDQALLYNSLSSIADRYSFMAKLYGAPNLCYDKSASLALLSFRWEISMSEKRRDNRNPILREDEYPRKDGRYRFRYLDENGRGYSSIHSIYGVLRPAFQMAEDDDLIRKICLILSWHR